MDKRNNKQNQWLNEMTHYADGLTKWRTMPVVRRNVGLRQFLLLHRRTVWWKRFQPGKKTQRMQSNWYQALGDCSLHHKFPAIDLRRQKHYTAWCQAWRHSGVLCFCAHTSFDTSLCWKKKMKKKGKSPIDTIQRQTRSVCLHTEDSIPLLTQPVSEWLW